MPSWNVTTTASRLQVDANAVAHNPTAVLMDANHVAVIYGGSGSDGYAQVMTVNATTWAVTTANAALEFDTTLYAAGGGEIFKVDANHAVAMYPGSGNDGYIDPFTISTSTWAVTTTAARLEFDTVNATHGNAVAMDDNHYLRIWQGSAADGFAQVLTINTTSYAVTTAAASLEYDTQFHYSGGIVKIDSTHALISWLGGVSGTTAQAQVLAVNTTTWATTTAGSVFNWTAGGAQAVEKTPILGIDANHFLVIFVSGADVKAQVLTVNTSTWAVTTATTELNLGTGTAKISSAVKMGENHALVTYYNTSARTAEILAVNTSTWAVTTAGTKVVLDTSTVALETTMVQIDSTHVFIAYTGTSTYLYSEVLKIDASDPPTVALNDPADSETVTDTTPTLTFTGTDPEDDDITYQVQIDTSSTFNSQTTTCATFDADALYNNTRLASDVDNFSFAGWVKITDNTNENTIFCNGHGGSFGQGWKFIVRSSANSNTLSIDVSYVVLINSSLAITDTNWHYVGVRRSGGNWKFYLDGATETTGTGTPYTLDGSSKTIVGGYNNNSTVTVNFVGSMGRLGYWSTVLTDDNFESMYLGDTVNTLSTSLVMDLPLNSSANFGNNDGSGADLSISGTLTAGTIPTSPLINELSAINSGFSGTPDSTDPFDSGQAVTYTLGD